MSPTGDQNRLRALLVARSTGFAVFLVCYHHWSWARLVVAWLAQRCTRSTLERAQPCARRKISVIRTRPELVSVRNKSSNFSVRSSLRGLQFLVTRRHAASLVSIVRFSFLLPPPFSIPVSFDVPSTTAWPVHLRWIRATCDRYGARKFCGSIPCGRNSSHFSSPFIRSTLRSTLSHHRSFYFPSFHPIFLPRHQFFFLFSHLLHFLRPVVSGSPFFLQPLSPTFIRGSTAEILLFCFHLFFVRALACKARRDVAFL